MEIIVSTVLSSLTGIFLKVDSEVPAESTNADDSWLILPL